MPLTVEWWKHHREDRSAMAALVDQVALMLSDNPVGHEKPKSSAGFFGREMRLEKMVTVVVGNSRTVV